jgi:hypothetical protein
MELLLNPEILTSYIYGSTFFQRWKPSTSICCTMFQHWINAESYPVAQLCVNTLLATKVTLITDGILFGRLRVKGLMVVIRYERRVSYPRHKSVPPPMYCTRMSFPKFKTYNLRGIFGFWISSAHPCYLHLLIDILHVGSGPYSTDTPRPLLTGH